MFFYGSAYAGKAPDAVVKATPGVTKASEPKQTSSFPGTVSVINTKTLAASLLKVGESENNTISSSFYTDGFTIVVDPSVPVRGIAFEFNGRERVEKAAPFVLTGNVGTVYKPWTPPLGKNIITITITPEVGSAVSGIVNMQLD
jgi:hypothetical protein